MSSLASVLVSRLSSLSPSQHDSGDTDSIVSSQDTCSSLASSSVASSSAGRSFDTRSVHSDSAIDVTYASSDSAMRRNEHLAVLLPKDLWKPDSQASRCDIFLCSKRFSIFERRHHCRKCGNVVCADCSTRATTLLDTTHLEFFHPPRGVAISAFASPSSPVALSRVCDECWDQIHGTRTSRAKAASEHSQNSSSASSASCSPKMPMTPLDGCSISSNPQRIRRTRTTSGVSASPLRTTVTPPPTTVVGVQVPDELEAYPLKQASAICKANGGGRWQPKPIVHWVGHRVPGGKAQFEIEIEQEEAENRRRRLNPVIKDGDFQLRVPREIEPRSPGGPVHFSTF